MPAAAAFLASIEPPVHELFVLIVVWSSVGMRSLMRLFEDVECVVAAAGCGNCVITAVVVVVVVLFMFRSNLTFAGRRMALAS